MKFLWGECRFQVSTCLFQYFFNRLHWCHQWAFFLWGILTLFFLSQLVLCKSKQYTFADQNVHNISEINVSWYIEKSNAHHILVLFSWWILTAVDKREFLISLVILGPFKCNIMLFYIWFRISWCLALKTILTLEKTRNEKPSCFSTVGLWLHYIFTPSVPPQENLTCSDVKVNGEMLPLAL